MPWLTLPHKRFQRSLVCLTVVLQHRAIKWTHVTNYTVQTIQGDMKNLPIKRTLEDVKNPETARQ